MDYEYGHLQYLHPFNQSVLNQNKFKDVHDVKEIISGILYSLKNIYEMLNIRIKFELNVKPIFFCISLKKLVSCIIAVIFILKISNTMEDEIQIADSLNSLLCV